MIPWIEIMGLLLQWSFTGKRKVCKADVAGFANFLVFTFIACYFTITLRLSLPLTTM